jgi:hypothetical protein
VSRPHFRVPTIAQNNLCPADIRARQEAMALRAQGCAIRACAVPQVL